MTTFNLKLYFFYFQLLHDQTFIIGKLKKKKTERSRVNPSPQGQPMKGDTYRTKAKTRDQSFMKETKVKESDGRNSIDYCKNIIQLESSFSCSMMGLQIQASNSISYFVSLSLLPRIKQFITIGYLNIVKSAKIKIKQIFIWVLLQLVVLNLVIRKQKIGVKQTRFEF